MSDTLEQLDAEITELATSEASPYRSLARFEVGFDAGDEAITEEARGYVISDLTQWHRIVEAERGPVPLPADGHNMSDFMRVVSPEAIDFYVRGMSEIYLSDEYREIFSGLLIGSSWKPENRLTAKFGRFMIEGIEGHDEPQELLVMAPLIAVGSISGRSDLFGIHEPQHRDIEGWTMARNELLGYTASPNYGMHATDWGRTTIDLDTDGQPELLHVYDRSVKFGRATAEGRADTVDHFARVLDGVVTVVNGDSQSVQPLTQ